MTTKEMMPHTCAGGPSCTHNVKKHWDDGCRRQQAKRFSGLQVQRCDKEAEALAKQIKAQATQFPPHVRVDVPDARLLSAILGLYRTAATLRENPFSLLELSLEQIAKLVCYGKSQVAAALRWLGVGDIKYRDEKVAVGLGIIKRTRRKGKATICGKIQTVYRTSLQTLTDTGQQLLGLLIKLPKQAGKVWDKAEAKRDRVVLVEQDRKRAIANVATMVMESLRGSQASNPVPVEEPDLLNLAALPEDMRKLFLGAHNAFSRKVPTAT